MATDHKQMLAWMGLIHVASLLNRDLDRHLQEVADLSLAEKFALAQLALAGGELRMIDLAEVLLISKGGVTKLIDRLETEGFVKREHSKTDRRVINAILTSQGMKKLRSVQPIFRRWVAEHFADQISKSQMDTITKACLRILEANGHQLNIPEAKKK